MHLQTEGTGALNKSALHYIVPPAVTDSAQNKNLYPIIVNAFQNNHIALTQNRKNAAYLVTWGTETQSKQRRELISANSSPDWNNNLNVNSYTYYGAANGISATGPQYASVMQSYHMQNFTINVWNNTPSANKQSTPAWSGSASTSLEDAKNPAGIINDIVARYGTNFEGESAISNH